MNFLKLYWPEFKSLKLLPRALGGYDNLKGKKLNWVKMSEKGTLLSLGEETEANYGDLFNPDEEAVASEPLLASKQPNKTPAWYEKIRSSVAIDRNLLLYKVFYFFYFAALGSLVPYLSLYFKHSLLLPAHFAGIVLAVKPLCLFVSAPVMGTIADKYNKAKTVLLMALFSYIVMNFLVAVVPPVSADCLSEVHNKLNITHGHNATKEVSHRLGNVKPEHKNAEGIVRFGNTEMWDEAWLFDLYTQNDPKLYKNAEVVFIIILVITIVGELLGATSNTLADVATFQNLENRPHYYGEQRLWGEVGWGISAFITGSIVQGQYRKRTDICPEDVFDIYRPFFYVNAILMAVALFVSTRFDYQDGDKHVSEKCSLLRGLQIFTKVEYALFGTIALFLGITLGTSETFLFVHLVELGASPSLFSALVAVHCVSNVALYFGSVYFLKMTGHIKMLIAGLLIYALRFYYFSAIENPWLVLPIEFLRGICSASVWCALASYVGTPPRVGATLQGILHGLYYGLGKGLGQLIGGILIRGYGADPFFRYFALVDFVVMIAVALLSPFLSSRPTIWMSLSGYSPLETNETECCQRIFKALGIQRKKTATEEN